MSEVTISKRTDSARVKMTLEVIMLMASRIFLTRITMTQLILHKIISTMIELADS
jgi:hypothetical protein